MKSFTEKIMTRDALCIALTEERAKGRRIVFTNGCFDLVHVGHVTYLAAAKARGDTLVVAVNTADSLGRLKATQRVIVNPSETDRMQILAALESVDYVTSFSEDTPQSLIEAITPDVLVKGGDWSPETIVGADHVRAYGGEVIVIPFLEGYSTTTIIKRIIQSSS